MKLETAIIILKGLCYTLIGAFTPWSAALAQWANADGEWPAKIIWIGVILPASIVGGASGLLAFLTTSYGTYKQKLKENAEAHKTGG